MAIKVYEYTDDVGETISIRLDDAKAALGGFTNSQNASGVMGPTPNGRIRGVYFRGTGNNGNKRLFIPCATPGNALYNAKTQQTRTYKNVQYISVSSRGEKRLHAAASQNQVTQ